MKNMSKVKKDCALAAGILMCITAALMFIYTILGAINGNFYDGLKGGFILLGLGRTAVFIVAGIMSFMSMKNDGKIFAAVSLILMVVLVFASAFRMSNYGGEVAEYYIYILTDILYFADIVLSAVTVVAFNIDGKKSVQKNQKLEKDIELIAKYKLMYDDGLLSAEEFEASKRRILEGKDGKN